MISPVQWAPDGTPRSVLFDDIYRSQNRLGRDLGLEQARQVFLQGCGLWAPDPALPRAWQGRRHWQILETGFGLGLNFLATWQAWQQDPDAPTRLVYVGIEAHPVQAQDLLQSVQAHPELQPLAAALAAQWTGLLPGVHRLEWEQGRVQLLLCIGDVQTMLREIDTPADSVFLDGFNPSVNPQMWSSDTLGRMARLARRGTRVATWCVRRSLRDTLSQCGFVVERVPGMPPKSQRLQARFEPAWTPRTAMRAPAFAPSVGRRAVVIGAGLSGSAVACSLARRGWQVDVLEQGPAPCSGASGLPAGLTAPHNSPDDSLLSRITRAGVSATLQRCAQLLAEGSDWAASGVLEHQVEGKHRLPGAWPESGASWSRPASAMQKQQAGLPPSAPALWHERAGWVRPVALVHAQLATPGVQLHLLQRVIGLTALDTGGWQVQTASGWRSQADLVVLAAGHDTLPLWPCTNAQPPLPLQALRGQVSLGPLSRLPEALQSALPPFPVNGHGSWLKVPGNERHEAFWILGSTFERGQREAQVRKADHAANHARLERLLPWLSEPMRASFGTDEVQGWAGIRCTLSDRLPAVGPTAVSGGSGLAVCTGMGARGISLSVLCGEWLAAWAEGEAWPMAQSLAKRLSAARFTSSLRPDDAP